ncbi:MAG: NUDIX domain-containing protein [Candidatus Paceibacterota bacterium]
MQTEHGIFGVGVGVMIKRGNTVLLGKRHSDRDKADSDLEGQGSWTFPGGSVEFNENLADAVLREVKEETGLEVDPTSLQLISVADDKLEKKKVHFVTIGFLVPDITGEATVMEPDEITEWRWFEIDDLPTPLFKPTKKMVEQHRENKLYVHR